MTLISPDVFLNGKRSYVQGTQLLSRAAEYVHGQISPGAKLKTAAFHTITDRLVDIAFAEQSGELDRELGFCQFVTASAEPLKAIFLEGPDVAPRRDVPPACRYTRVDSDLGHVLSGDWDVENAHSLEDVLVALIQTIKSQHEDIGAGVHDIWFTGFRGAMLPLSAPFPTGKGLIRLRFARYMGNAEQYQSMQTVTLIPDGEEASKPFPVTFAFKTESPIDAD